MSWRSPRNQGHTILNVFYYTARLKLFLHRWHSEGPTSGMSHLSVLWCGRQWVTIVGNCKARVNCKGSVVRQLASRWANDGPAGHLSRSQWVWLWDVPEVLVWTAWNPQGKHRPPTPCVSPSVSPDQSIHSRAAPQKQVQTALSLLRISVWRIKLSWKLLRWLVKVRF